MIDRLVIESVLEEFPNFQYELNPIGNDVELSIVRTDKKDEWGARKIRKVLKKDDDLTVLKNVLKGKEG